MKTYKLKGLEYYITDCRNIVHAITTCLCYSWGVTENDIEEFHGIIPENAIKVVESV